MGGVPFQSKGCSTCKSRKIRCDLQQPECARCLKRGLSCPGYSKPRTFVHYQSTKRLVAASQTGVAAAQSSSRSSLGVAQNVPMPLSVNSHPEARSQIFSSFLSAYFPLNTVGLVGADVWYHLFTGFATLPSKTGTSASLLDKSLCALTCVGLGQIKQDQQLIYYGTSLYHAAIRHMSSMIQHNTPNEQLLYATVIFQRLEPLFAPLGVEAWIAHAEGTNAFLRKCHRDDPQNPLIGSIYQHQKVLGVSDPLKPSEKAGRPLGGIYEIYASFKPILAGFKKLNSFNTPEYCQSLLQECILHKDSIITWFANEKPSLGPDPAPYPNFKSTCAHLPSTDEVFGPAYDFPDLKSALNHVMYWTALSLVYPMIYQAKINTMAHAGRTRIIDPNTDQDYMLSWYYADEACRGIPYCLTNTEHIWGAQRAMFPIAQASQIYSNLGWREKFMWCQNAFTAIEHLGFGLAVCLREAALKHWFVSGNAQVISTSTALPFRDESPQRQTPYMEEPVGNIQVSEVVELSDDP